MASPVVRGATHAGSWYNEDKDALNAELDAWLNEVPNTIEGVGTLPVKGARLIIAPWVVSH